MQTIRKADEKAWADNVDFESEIKDAAVVELGFAIDGTWSGGAGTIAQDAALKSLGRIEFNHNGPRIANVDPRLLFYNSALIEGGVKDLVATGAATGTFYARLSMPFQRIVPFGGMDTIGRTAAFKGRYRSGTAVISGGATVATSTRVRPTAKTAPAAPTGGFRDPEWRQETITCDASSVSQNSRRIEFKADMVVPYLLLMALDFNGDTAGLTDTSLRTDGLVQRITIDRYGKGGAVLRIVDDVSWGTLRNMTCQRLTAADVTATAGIVRIPLIDPNEKDGLMRMPAGSHLTITCDTASTVEASYTDVVPAAGDTVEVLVPSFYELAKQTPRNAATAAEVSARAANRRGRII